MTNQRRRSVSHFLRYRNRDRLRVNVPHRCLKQFDEIKNHLKLRSHRGAVDWLLGHDMKGLVELTNELGYANGGQTIDWLLAMGMGTERIVNFRQGQIGGQTVNLSLPSETRALVELTRELGFNRGGETVDWLLQMATNPMIELMNSLGFKSGTKTIDWLLNQAQPSIAAAKLNGFKPSEPSKLSSGVNITPQFPSKQLKTPGFETPEFHNFNTQPHNQLESNHGQRFTEKQQQVQFDSNGSGELAERHFLNGNGGLSNRSRGVKRGRQEAEAEYNQNQNQFVNNHAQNQIQFVNSHDQNQNIFENIHLQSQFESIHGRNQNQFVNMHTQTKNQFVNSHDQNQNLFENIHPQSQFENIHTWNQNQFVNMQTHTQNQFVNIHDQNRGGIQRNHGGNSGSSLSYEEQKNAGTINNWFVNGLAP